MPKVDLTMNQWGEALRAVRHMKQAHGVSESTRKDLDIIEDRIIDMAFQLAKETEESVKAKRSIQQFKLDIV